MQDTQAESVSLDASVTDAVPGRTTTTVASLSDLDVEQLFLEVSDAAAGITQCAHATRNWPVFSFPFLILSCLVI